MKPTHLALASLILVAACAGSVRLTQLDVASTYDAGEFAYAAAGRDLHVVIVGNPFGGDQDAFETAVTDAMQGRHWGQATNFTTTPGDDARLSFRVVLIFDPPPGGDDARLSFRVVLIFDPPPGMNAARQCREEALAVQTVPADSQIELSAAFCSGDSARTRIRGRVSGAKGPQDRAFRELVGQVTNGLFPPDRGRNRPDRGRNRSGGCRPPLMC
jgi:hypothetical protein